MVDPFIIFCVFFLSFFVLTLLFSVCDKKYDFNQQTASEALIGWLKYTTAHTLHVSILMESFIGKENGMERTNIKKPREREREREREWEREREKIAASFIIAKRHMLAWGQSLHVTFLLGVLSTFFSPCLFLHLFVCLMYICEFILLSICLSLHFSVCLTIPFLSVWLNVFFSFCSSHQLFRRCLSLYLFLCPFPFLLHSSVATFVRLLFVNFFFCMSVWLHYYKYYSQGIVRILSK